MALDELHARRLETVATVVEAALDRIELVLRGSEGVEGVSHLASRFTPEQARHMREVMARIRQRLAQAMQRFEVARRKPDPRRVLNAELSTLWVVLENALPKRLKGYGKEFAPGDKAEWEDLINSLLGELEQIRSVTRAKHNRPRQQTPQ
jgi:hypothetical protein